MGNSRVSLQNETRNKPWWARAWGNYEVKLGLIAFIVLVIDRFILYHPYYTNSTIASFAGFNLLIVIPVTLLLITGKLDLSIWTAVEGANYLFYRLTYDNFMTAGHAVLVTLFAMLMVGMVNGLGVSLFGLPSWLVTFATGLVIPPVIRFLITSIPGITSPIDEGFGITDATRLGYANAIIVALLIFLIVEVLIHRISLFRQVFFINRKQNSPVESGRINYHVVTFALYLFSGLMAGICGICYFQWLRIPMFFSITHEELFIFAVCLVGGCSLWGGKGSLIGSFLALLLLESTTSILYTPLISKGYYIPGEEDYLIFFAALIFCVWRYRRRDAGKNRPDRLPLPGL